MPTPTLRAPLTIFMQQLKFKLYEEELIDPLAGHELTEPEKYVASLLLRASAERPVGLREIINNLSYHQNKTFSERMVKSLIRSLRRDHLFPILASRQQPAGYFWCQSAEEMEAFIQQFKSQALDELSTLSKIVRHTYPALVGQLRFDEQF